jgi:hypothetical protein
LAVADCDCRLSIAIAACRLALISLSQLHSAITNRNRQSRISIPNRQSQSALGNRKIGVGTRQSSMDLVSTVIEPIAAMLPGVSESLSPASAVILLSKDL